MTGSRTSENARYSLKLGDSGRNGTSMQDGSCPVQAGTAHGFLFLRKLEDCHRPHKCLGLILHAFSRRGGFLDQCGVLLGYLIDLGDGLVHLGDAVALLFAGGRDLADDGGDAAHLSHDLIHGGTCALDELCALVHLADGGRNHPLDFLGGFGGTLSETSHFGGESRCQAVRRFHRRWD